MLGYLNEFNANHPGALMLLGPSLPNKSLIVMKSVVTEKLGKCEAV